MVLEDKGEYGITVKNILEITKIVSFKMKKLKEILFDEYDLSFSNKNLSEIIGKIFEKEIAEYLSKATDYLVVNAKSDQDPDLRFIKNGEDKKFIEIKVTSTDNAWTGGEFSKRPFDYLLISWEKSFENYFIAYTHLEKEEWESNIEKGFYGPSFNVKKLNSKTDKVILFGTINQSGSKLIRENINQTKLF